MDWKKKVTDLLVHLNVGKCRQEIALKSPDPSVASRVMGRQNWQKIALPLRRLIFQNLSNEADDWSAAA